MSTQSRAGRTCSRVGCRAIATSTLTYIYSDSTAVLGPLATFSEPHSYDLCDRHSSRLTVPNGWNVIRHISDDIESGPSEDDLMAIADAVREVAHNHQGAAAPVANAVPQSGVGRRGHLRAVPS